MYSIDWLTVQQEFPTGVLPVFAGDLITVQDSATGELKCEFYKSFQHEGSYSSSLKIRCDGNRLEVDGNPSRWSRPDNLFGVTSVDRCIEIYNQVLEALGLPQFDENTLSGQQLQSSDSVADFGPIIKRVDICRGFEVGAGNQLPLLRWLATQVYRSKPGNLYPNGRTVDWMAGSRHLYFKYYCKATDLRRLLKKYKGTDLEDYIRQVIEYAERVGLVRFEISLKAQYLKKKGLHKRENWTMDKVIDLCERYMMHKRGTVERGQFDTIADQLVEAGYTQNRAVRCEQIALAWLAGSDPKSRMSRATYYRYRKPLLDMGIDIGAPCNVTALPVKTRTIDIIPAEPPTWYRRA